MIRASCLNKAWPIRPLGEVVEFLDHKRKPITAKDRVPGPYPYYGANGQQDSVNDYIFDETLILLAEDGGHFGEPDKNIAYMIEGKSWVNNHAHVLRPNNEIVDLRFLLRHLERYDVMPFITGATRAKLNKGVAQKIPVSLPPLAEQKRIAGILDQADAIRRKRHQAIDKLNSLIPAVFNDMFGFIVKNTKGWPVVKFNDIASSRLGKMLDKKQQTGNHKRPYLRNVNVQWGRFDFSEMLEMDFNKADRKEFSLLNGDVLICEGGEIGRSAIWNGKMADCYFQKAIHRVRPNPEKATPEFILYFMWEMANGGGFEHLKSQATIAHLTGVKLKALSVPLPPIDLQLEFSKKVKEIDKLKEKQKQAAAREEALFNSLVQRAFKGEL